MFNCPLCHEKQSFLHKIKAIHSDSIQLCKHERGKVNLLTMTMTIRDEIKSSGKISILSQFKIARTPCLPPPILNLNFPTSI